jgi:hypothetical protein
MVDAVVDVLVDGVIEVKLTNAGPTAVIEKLPVAALFHVVTTKTYVRKDCRLGVIRNCPLPALLSSNVNKFSEG